MFYSLLAALAAIGFFASLVCNIMAWMHINPPYGQSVFLFHFVALGLGFALIYFNNKIMPKSSRNNVDPLFAEVPRWVNVGANVIFFYAFLNFFWSMYCIIHFYPKGKEQPMWVQVRPFSGLWMMFFTMEWMAFTGLARLKRKRVEQIPRFPMDTDKRFK